MAWKPLFFVVIGTRRLITHRTFWKALFTLRWHENTRVVMGDLHRLIGAWCSPVMLTLGITGLYFNIAEYYHEVFEHANEAPFVITEKQYSNAINFQRLMTDSRVQLERFTPTYVLFPYEPDLHITYYGFQPDDNPFASQYASTVTYHKTTGEFIAAHSGPEAAALMQVLDSFRTLHFGDFGGLTSKIIWCIAGLAPAVLSVTGLYIWFSRGRKKKATSSKLKLSLQAR